MRLQGAIAAGSALVALALFPGAAGASTLLSTDVAVPRAVDASCTNALRPVDAGVAHRRLTVPAAGYVKVRLAGSGEWDLAVFRPGDDEPVAGSAYPGADELAAGYVRARGKVIVQACRRSGRRTSARINVQLERVKPLRGRLSLVRVSTPTRARKDALLRLGLDLTEHGGPGFVDVLLHGRRDARLLRTRGFTYKVAVRDVAAQAARHRAADKRYAREVTASALPSGRTTYRRLFEITAEMQSLATGNSDIVRRFTLPHPSGEGRPVEALEITTDPSGRDGRPVFLLVGMHHAREWPAADIQMEWARQLVDDYRAGSTRARTLLSRVRTLIVPVTNPDGFNASREDGQARLHGAGDTSFNSTWNEYRRKNCRQANGTHSCGVSANDLNGVDPNRNYSAFYGGIGSSTVLTSENYRGTGPFSEPDTQNIRELVANRQVVGMITTHTFGRTILRQPGVDSEPPTPDEPAYKALGDSLGVANGYHSQYSKDLYDHGGTTDAWHYFVTGGLGFVFEMNQGAFHPPFADMVAEYDGTIAGANGGNREALYRMTEWTANPAGHGLLTGRAPGGSVLRLARDMTSVTQEGPDVTEHLESTMVVPASGQFEWHVNPSTSPFDSKSGGRANWTLTCESPDGAVRSTQSLFVARGESVTLDLPCGVQPPPTVTPEPPPEPVEVIAPPGVKARLGATWDGKRYRARVSGSLLDPKYVPGGSRCAGRVSLTITAGGRRAISGRADLDAKCGFAKTFRFTPRKLPRKLRRRGARLSLRGIVTWPGNEHLLETRHAVSARVKRR